MELDYPDALLVGARFKKIGESLNSQIRKICKKYNIDIETRWIPLLSILYEKDGINVQYLAAKLGISHPAVVQLTNQLLKNDLIETKKLDADKRFTIINITKNGIEKFESVKQMLDDIDSVINLLLKQTNYDVYDILSKMEEIVANENLVKVLSDKEKEKQLSKIKVVSYDDKYKKEFKKLNTEWLKKYFTVESTDKIILDNPKGEIIEKGGEIFFALLEKQVVGTCAVIKVDKKTFEIAKMAVKESDRGKQIGKKLGLTAIGFAVARKARKIVLDTNYKLTTAVQLYRKLGFTVIPFEYDNKYQRELIRMELNIK